MQLHTITGEKNKSKKRVGRGGKRGTTSGRGQKGQRARAGHRIRPAARDLIMRMPKKRGAGKNKNRRKSMPALVLSLSKLQSIQDQKITRELLLKLRLLRNAKQEVKILSSGAITSAKEISGMQVSKAARQKIEQAGGRIVEG